MGLHQTLFVSALDALLCRAVCHLLEDKTSHNLARRCNRMRLNILWGGNVAKTGPPPSNRTTWKLDPTPAFGQKSLKLSVCVSSEMLCAPSGHKNRTSLPVAEPKRFRSDEGSLLTSAFSPFLRLSSVSI